MVLSSIQPKLVELISVDENSNAYFKLRKNIIEKAIANDFTEQTDIVYEFDEVELTLTFTNTLEEEINSNFENYFTLGKTQLQDIIDYKSKTDESKLLMDGNLFKQLDLNVNNKQQQGVANDMINGFIDWYFSTHPNEL